MDIRTAQRDINRAYLGGAPGVLVSGLVWIAASLADTFVSVERGVAVLLIGGALIYPVSTLVCRMLLRVPPAAPDNPLSVLAFESTVALFAGVFISFALLFVAPYLVFPLFAIIVGARYFVFSTVYGNQVYWVVGGALFGIGVFTTISPDMIPVSAALPVGLAEVALSALVFATRREVDR